MFDQELRTELETVLQSTLINKADADVFTRYLVFVYHVIKASEPLLEHAVQRSEGTPYHAYFIEHLAEERSHEKWLEDDLHELGVDVAKAGIPVIAVQMAGSAFYLVNCVTPLALLGYMACLEFFPTPIEEIETLEALHGKKALRTLRYHAEHDLDHGSDLAAVLNTLPVEDQLIVKQTAYQTAIYVQRAIAAIQ